MPTTHPTRKEPMPETMTLKCGAGHTWERASQRGRPPKFCPKHRGGSTPKKPQNKPQAPQNKKPRVVLPEEHLISPSPAAAKAMAASSFQPADTLSFESRIRPRELVPVSDVQVGDWTHLSGFRPVAAVKQYPRKKAVRLTWADGTSETFSYTHKDHDTGEALPRMVRVLRKENVS